MLKNKNQSIAKIINKKNNQEYEVASVIAVGNKTVDIRMLSGGIYRHVPLSGSAKTGDEVRVLFIKGKPTAMAGGVSGGGTTQVIITQGEAAAPTPGDYAPTPHDALGIHHVWPSVGANAFLATTSTPGNPAFRGLLLSDIQSVADTRYALSSRTITAGNGLTGSGTLNANITLNVGGGDGISVGADGLSVALASNSGLEFSSGLLKVNLNDNGGYESGLELLSGGVSIRLSASSGLELTSTGLKIDLETISGLELLSTGLRLDLDNTVGDNSGLQILSTGVSIKLGTTSLELVSGGLSIANSIAGDGIGINASKVLSVASNTTFSNSSPALNGVQTETDGIRLYASNNPGANEHILATSSAGQLTIPTLQATSSVIAPLVTSSSSLVIGSGVGTGIYLNPANNIVYLNSNKSFQSDGYASQTTGMRITHSGEGDFRYIFTDELHAKSFIADLEQALAGGQIIAKSVAVLAENFILPAAGGTGTLIVEDLPSAENMAVFQNNDWVGLRQFSRSGGSLTISWAWGRVTLYQDLADKKQSWTFTRDATTPGAATGTISADSLVLDFGTSGNGFYEVNAIDGAYGLNSPYAQTVTWQTHPATQTVRSRMGNLRGIFSQADEFGIYGGTGTSNSSRYFRASSYEVELRNVPLRLYAGANLTTEISGGSSNNSPYFAMGATLPTGPLTNSGIWMGLDSTLYKFRVGAVSGGALTAGMIWDGSQLNIVGSMKLSGSTYTTPTQGAGLYADANRIGYFDGTNWNSFIQSNGNFYLGGTSGSLTWSGTQLNVIGSMKLSGTTYTTPSGAGLYADGSRIGYFDGTNWNSFIQSNGNFYLGGTSGNLTWNGTQLNITGSLRLSGTTYATPSISGLYGDSSRIGYYNATAGQGGWRAWFDSSGNLTLRSAPVASGTTATGIVFTSSDGVLKGGYYTAAAGPSYGAFVTQWQTDAGSGAILAGGGEVILNADGVRVKDAASQTPNSYNAITFGDRSTNNYAQIYSWGSGKLNIESNTTTNSSRINMSGQDVTLQGRIRAYYYGLTVRSLVDDTNGWNAEPDQLLIYGSNQDGSVDAQGAQNLDYVPLKLVYRTTLAGFTSRSTNIDMVTYQPSGIVYPFDARLSLINSTSDNLILRFLLRSQSIDSASYSFWLSNTGGTFTSNLNVGDATGAGTGKIKTKILSTEVSGTLESQDTQIIRYKFGPTGFDAAYAQPYLQYDVTSALTGRPYGTFLITFSARENGDNFTSETWQFYAYRHQSTGYIWSSQRIAGTARVTARQITNNPTTGQLTIGWWIGGASSGYNDGLEVTVTELAAGHGAGHLGTFSMQTGAVTGTSPTTAQQGNMFAGSIVATNQVDAFNGYLIPSSNNSAVFAMDASSEATTTVANAGTYYPFTNANNFSGLIMITNTSNRAVGIFVAGAGGIAMISDSSGNTYSNAGGTALRINVYISGSAIIVQNNIGSSRDIRVVGIRMNTAV